MSDKLDSAASPRSGQMSEAGVREALVGALTEHDYRKTMQFTLTEPAWVNDARAALSASQQPGQMSAATHPYSENWAEFTGDQTGWILEKDDPPVYHLVTDDYDEHWTSDVNKALRFARKEDAEAYMDHVGWTAPPVRTAEHMWVAPRVVRYSSPRSPGGMADTVSLRSMAAHERDHKGNDALARVIELTADKVDRLRAQVEHARVALQFAIDGFDNHDVNHEEYRCRVHEVAVVTMTLLPPQDGKGV